MPLIQKIICGLTGLACATPFLLFRGRPAHIIADQLIQEMTPEQLEEFMKD